MKFRELIVNHFDSIKENLFKVEVDKELMWKTYLESFPEEVRQENNCNCCKSFIKRYGNIVTIKENKIISLWEFDGEDEYAKVAKNMRELLKGKMIKEKLIVETINLGTHHNIVTIEAPKGFPDKIGNRYDHLNLIVPEKYVHSSSESIAAIQGANRDTMNVFKRALDEITPEAIELALALIKNGYLFEYHTEEALRVADKNDDPKLVKPLLRGAEMVSIVEAFKVHKDLYLKSSNKDIFVWVTDVSNGLARIRNSAIGTLLQKFTEGADFNYIIESYETMMQRYKVVKNLTNVTAKEIEQTQANLTKLGYIDALARRYAVEADLDMNDVLYADRNAKIQNNIFDVLKDEVIVNPKKLGKAIDISITDFIKDIVPKATKMEALFSNKLEPNLMTLLGAKNPEAKSMLKWDRPFTPYYIGGNADSIRKSVKKHGGNIDNAVLRCSLEWSDKNQEDNSDLDIHCIEPNGRHISYENAKYTHPSSGVLDVDILTPCDFRFTDIVENITWSDKSRMQEGEYKVYIKNYRNTNSKGFRAEIEYNNIIYYFNYTKPLRDREDVTVAKFHFSKKDGIKFIESLDSTTSSKEVFNLKTETFQEVSLMMYSPNYWGENAVGNKHVFFILKGAKMPEAPKGFFNEFLNEELRPDRKVLELLSNKIKIEDSDNQLTGLGFSETQKNNMVVKVTTSYPTLYNIQF